MSELVVNSSPFGSPDLQSMPRADVPAVWTGYRERFESIKKTAVTLTVTSVDQVAEMKLARETRLQLKHIRTEVENKRKELGEEALRRSQRINAQARELKDLIEPLETRLLEQETFADRERLRLQQELRDERLRQVFCFLPLGVANPGVDLAAMSAEEFEGYKADLQDVCLARQEREKKEAEERAKAEALREKSAAAERDRLAKENKKLEKQAAKDREAREKAEAIAKTEREQRQARERAEQQTERERKAEEKRLARASDKVKLEAFAVCLDILVVPELKDKEQQALIETQIVKFAKWVRGLGEK